MGRRKIKLGRHKPKLRGRRATQAYEQDQRRSPEPQRIAARRIKAMEFELKKLWKGSKGVDEDGQPCFYCKLRLLGGHSAVEEYKKNMAAALIKWAGKKELTPIQKIQRNLDVRDFIQSQIDKGVLGPTPCAIGEVPVARVYKDERDKIQKIIALAEGDPAVKPIIP